MERGYYLMYRGWMNDPLFKKESFCERLAWEWLIHEASFEPHKIRYGKELVEVKRGQVPTSFRKLKDVWGWSLNRVRNFLALLKKDGKIETGTDTGFIVITICNYDKFQFQLRNADTPTDSQPDTLTDTSADTNINKRKESKEEEYIHHSFEKSEIETKFETFWESYRKKVGKKTARQRFDQALQKVKFEEIMEGLHRYNRTKEVLDGFVMHPERWLVKERWTDECINAPTPKTQEEQVCSCGKHFGLLDWTPERRAQAYAWYRTRLPGQYNTDCKQYLESYEKIHGKVAPNIISQPLTQRAEVYG